MDHQLTFMLCELEPYTFACIVTVYAFLRCADFRPHDQQGETPPHLDMSVYLTAVIPIGLATAGDILLSNLSYIVSTVSFYTIVKSGSLIW